jgi:hypothetical protein
MDAQIMKAGSLSDASPHRVQVHERLAGDIAANDVGIVGGSGNHVKPGNRGPAQRRQDGIPVFGVSNVESAVVPIDVLRVNQDGKRDNQDGKFFEEVVFESFGSDLTL